MPSRHRSRQRALQVLYQVDLNKQAPFDAIDDFYETLYTAELEQEPIGPTTRPPRDGFMEQLVRKTADRTADIDKLIAQHSAHWRVERMPAVDRNILRLAVYEMVNETTPPAVVIDEALELARKFSGDESVAFINGVLDAIRKSIQEPPAEPAAPAEPESAG